MTQSRFIRSFLLVTLVVVSLHRASEVQACSLGCPTPLRPPLGSIPANGLAIPIFTPNTVVKVVGPDGPVSLQFDAAKGVLRPTSDLALGQHTITYDRTCPGLTTTTVTETFEATGSASPPTAFGTLAVESAGVVGATTVFVRASMVFDPALFPYLDLTDLRAQVDGLPLSSFNLEFKGAMNVQTFCGADRGRQPIKDSCGGVIAVAPGRHHLAFYPTVAGIGELPAATLDVTTDCGWLTAIDPQPMSDGCAVAGSGSMDPLGVGGALFLVTVLVTRRRGFDRARGLGRNRG